MCKNCLSGLLAMALVVSCGAATVEKGTKKTEKADFVAETPRAEVDIQDTVAQEDAPVCQSCQINRTPDTDEQA